MRVCEVCKNCLPSICFSCFPHPVIHTVVITVINFVICHSYLRQIDANKNIYSCLPLLYTKVCLLPIFSPPWFVQFTIHFTDVCVEKASSLFLIGAQIALQIYHHFFNPIPVNDRTFQFFSYSNSVAINNIIYFHMCKCKTHSQR